jgi:uncharacterized protein
VNPLYLGSSERRIFAVYEAAAVSRRHTRAAVLCCPWGAEYVYAHRSMRQLAVKLSLCGFHTLRFDFYGTGDSDGDMAEADLDGWEADAQRAIEGIRDIVGNTRVTLIGMRLGANIAAAAALRQAETCDALVLWDPILSGEQYLHSLQERPGANIPDDSGGIEVDGFLLTSRMADGVKKVNLRPTLSAPPCRTLMLVTEPAATQSATQDSAVADPKLVSVEMLQAPLPWVEAVTTSGAVPVQVMRRITEWLS